MLRISDLGAVLEAFCSFRGQVGSVRPQPGGLHWAGPSRTGDPPLATPNYSYEKRQRELAKKRKAEEKRQRKLNGRPADEAAPAEDAPSAPDAEPSPDSPAEPQT